MTQHNSDLSWLADVVSEQARKDQSGWSARIREQTAILWKERLQPQLREVLTLYLRAQPSDFPAITVDADGGKVFAQQAVGEESIQITHDASNGSIVVHHRPGMIRGGQPRHHVIRVYGSELGRTVMMNTNSGDESTVDERTLPERILRPFLQGR